MCTLKDSSIFVKNEYHVEQDGHVDQLMDTTLVADTASVYLALFLSYFDRSYAIPDTRNIISYH